MKKCLLFFFLLLGLSSCSDGWNKDAFADKSESVKNALPPGERRKRIPPPDKDVIFMDIEPVYSVREGGTLKIPIQYTIGHPDVKFERIVIQNSDEFPGLIYDERFQTIFITPPDETVDFSSKYKLYPLEISLFAEYEGLILESVKKTNIMIIPKSQNRGVVPKILKVVNFPSNTLVGHEYNFHVYVKGSSEQPPHLQVYSKNKNNNGGARYFSISNPSNGFKDEEILGNCNCADSSEEEGLDIWEFDVTLKLPKTMRIVEMGENYDVSFVTYSIYGIPSRNADKRFGVSIEKAPEPQLIGDTVVRFVKGGMNSHTFLVIDVSHLARVSASCTSPQGATCQCEDHNENQSYSSCTLRWKPDDTGDFEVEVHKVSQIFKGDRLVHESKINEKFRIRVHKSESPEKPAQCMDGDEKVPEPTPITQ